MLQSERGLVDLMEQLYPNLRGQPGAALQIARSLPVIGPREPKDLEGVSFLTEANWYVGVVGNQSALGIPSGGTSFSVLEHTGGPVTISAAGGTPYLGATVKITSGIAKGQRTKITDIRQVSGFTYITVADTLPLDTGDAFLVLANAYTVNLLGQFTETLLMNQAALAKSASYPSTIGAAGTYLTLGKRVYALSVSLRVTYGSAITSSPTVAAYAGWSDPTVSSGGIQWDTDSFASGPSPSTSANNTKQKTSLITPGGAEYVAFQVTNNDGTNALGQFYLSVQEVDG